MDIREFIHSGPLILVTPTVKGGETYLACLVHTGGNFGVQFVTALDAPAFINPKTDQVCHWMLPLIWGQDYSKLLAHEKIKLRFDDCLVDPTGKTQHRQWQWSDWVPYRP